MSDNDNYKDQADYKHFYKEMTRDILVSVRSFYLEDESEPEDGQYVWAYQIYIENNGDDSVQLKRRYWHITDAQGKVNEVEGEGVVGEQPVIHPGEVYEYMSGAPLQTPSGIMRGSYEMCDEAGELFNIIVPTFSLDSPYETLTIN